MELIKKTPYDRVDIGDTMNSNDLNDIIDKYAEFIREREETLDQERQRELTNQINEIRSLLGAYVDKQIKDGNVDKEFVNFVSKINALGILSSDMNLSLENIVSSDSNDVKYNLSSKFIVSELTGEEVPLEGLSNFQKIELIYVHTGCKISSDDRIFTQNRDRAFDYFMHSLHNYASVSQLKKMYGSNWKEEIEKVYKQGYDNAINSYINDVVEKVDIRNRERVVELEKQLLESEQEERKLQQEASRLREEISGLTAQILDMKHESKEDLIKYRESLSSMVVGHNNFEFTPEEKTKIVGALGICFEYDENKKNGIGIDNDFSLVVLPGTPIEQTTRQMMVCRHLGINVSATINGVTLNNVQIDNEQQLIDGYSSSVDTSKKM